MLIDESSPAWQLWARLSDFVKHIPPVYWTDEMLHAYKELTNEMYWLPRDNQYKKQGVLFKEEV